MKKIFPVVVFLFLAGAAWAQKPTTTYPYLYSEFQDGRAVMDAGNTNVRKMNLHLRHARMHYLEDGVIKEADLSDVLAVEIGQDVFIPVMGEMMKVVAKNDNGCVVAEILGNFEESNEAKGAYGTSSTTAATMKLSSVQDNVIGQNYMNVLNEREKGRPLVTVTKYFVVAPQFRCRATRKDIEEKLPGARREEWKAFLKAHKIKWNNPQSLLETLEFLK